MAFSPEPAFLGASASLCENELPESEEHPDERSRHRRQALLLRPAAVALADHGLARAAADGLRRGVLVQPVPGRAVDGRRRVRDPRLHAVRMVRHGDRRVRAPAVQPEGGPVVPLEHELVHLLGGDVLRRVLRRAVLHPQPVRARPREPGLEAAVAGLRRAVAHQRAVREGGVRADGRDRHPAPQHDHPADVGRDADDRAPRAQGGQPRRAEAVAVPDDRAGLHCSSASRRTSTTTRTPR